MDVCGMNQHMTAGGGQIVFREMHSASECGGHLGGPELDSYGWYAVVSDLQVRPKGVQL